MRRCPLLANVIIMSSLKKYWTVKRVEYDLCPAMRDGSSRKLAQCSQITRGDVVNLSGSRGQNTAYWREGLEFVTGVNN